MYNACCVLATARTAIAAHSEHDFRAHFRSEPPAGFIVVYGRCTTSWRKMKTFSELLYSYTTNRVFGRGGGGGFAKIFSDLGGTIQNYPLVAVKILQHRSHDVLTFHWR